jgi:hypothetical protein
MTDKAIRVLSFSGKQEDWRMWRAKYEARARFKGWLSALDGSANAPAAATVLDPANDAHADRIKLRKANDEGYADFIDFHGR